MPKKLTYEEVKQNIESLGYKLITKEFKNSQTKLTICDIKGYFYSLPYHSILNYQISVGRGKFSIYNPYTIQNIRLWCKLNKKPFELLSEKYEGSNLKLKWQCLKENCGEIFQSNWGQISIGLGCGE